MEYMQVSNVVVIERQASDLRTVAKYHDALLETCNDYEKSGAFLFKMVSAELEKKYRGIVVSFTYKHKILYKGGFPESRVEPFLYITFYNQKDYNKFKIVEGLLGKD